MGSERTTRWKHTDTHADLRAFLGDAAGLFGPGAQPAEREQQIDQLSDQYGLSRDLASKADSALELTRGDAQAAYEILTQWSLADSQILPQLLAPDSVGRAALLDDQPTHHESLALEKAAWSEVEANVAPQAEATASVEQQMSRRFARYVNACLESHATGENSAETALDDNFQQQLITAAVREFGLKPETARQTVAQLLPPATPPSDAAAFQGGASSSACPAEAAASPDTLPDLESIMEEEADWLDRERAAAQSQGQPDAAGQAQRDAFREYVEQRLNNISGNLLDARQWKKLRDHGTSQFGLPGADAGHLIEERAHRRRMQVLTPQRAVEQFSALAAAYYHRHGRFTAASRSRLVAAANRLGLDAAEARRILESPPPLEAALPATGRPHYRLLLGISAGAACTMIAFFLWVAWSQAPQGASVAERAASTPAATHSGPKSVKPFQAPPWWDQQTIAAAHAISGEDPALDRALVGISDPRPDQRTAAVLELLEGIDCASGAFANNRDQYRQVLVGYLALEPEQHSAVATFARIADSIHEFSAHWPTSPGMHDALFWRLEVLLSAIESPLTSRGRADAFAAVLTEAIQISLNAADDILAWRSACSLAVAERCYRVLMNSANRTPAAILEARQSLAAAARPFVPQVHLDRFESKLLCSLLLDGRQWHDFRDLVRHQVGSSDVHNVLRFVAAYEQMPISPARDQLGELLLGRAGLRRESRTSEQTARVVRAALDRGEQGDRFIDHWERFTFDAEQLMRAAAPRDEAELAQAALSVAHQNLLGTALAYHDGHGKLAFDQFAVEGPPQLGQQPPASPAPIFPVHPVAAPQLEMTRDSAEGLWYRAQLLANPLPNADPLHHWEIAVRIIQRWQEIPPPVAALLARYVLSPLDERTERVVLNDSRLLLSLHAFQLALADAIETSPLDDESLAARLSALLNKPVKFDQYHSRSEIRTLMLESVHRQLSRGARSSAPATPLPAMREHLTRIYQAKARLLNVSPGAYLTANNPADMLAAIVDQHIEASLDDDQGRVAQAALAAARFRARSELEEAVLIQHQWVRQLAGKVSARRHVDANRVAAVVKQWEMQNEEADSLLAQLYWSEAVELRLWLICNETN